jgi:hypothetical protein
MDMLIGLVFVRKCVKFGGVFLTEKAQLWEEQNCAMLAAQDPAGRPMVKGDTNHHPTESHSIGGTGRRPPQSQTDEPPWPPCGDIFVRRPPWK